MIIVKFQEEDDEDNNTESYNTMRSVSQRKEMSLHL